jgi:hypothetical protein
VRRIPGLQDSRVQVKCLEIDLMSICQVDAGINVEVFIDSIIIRVILLITGDKNMPGT